MNIQTIEAAKRCGISVEDYTRICIRRDQIRLEHPGWSAKKLAKILKKEFNIKTT